MSSQFATTKKSLTRPAICKKGPPKRRPGARPETLLATIDAEQSPPSPDFPQILSTINLNRLNDPTIEAWQGTTDTAPNQIELITTIGADDLHWLLRLTFLDHHIPVDSYLLEYCTTADSPYDARGITFTTPGLTPITICLSIYL
jgi:hypothetical protein